MKTLLVLSAVLVLMSCGKEIRQSPPNCIEMEPNPVFVTIPFKEGYSIQLPAGSSGPGIVIDKPISFRMQTSKGSQFFYAYFCVTDCQLYFGQNLASPVPPMISEHNNPAITYVKASEFCLNYEIQAILYHTPNPVDTTYGILYMKQGDDFKEALRMTFDFANMDEVESILATIAKE